MKLNIAIVVGVCKILNKSIFRHKKICIIACDFASRVFQPIIQGYKISSDTGMSALPYLPGCAVSFFSISLSDRK